MIKGLDMSDIGIRIGAESIRKENIPGNQTVNLSKMKNKQAGTYTNSSQPVAVG